MANLQGPRLEDKAQTNQSGDGSEPNPDSSLNTNFFTQIGRDARNAVQTIKPADRLNWGVSTTIDWTIGKFLSSQIAVASSSFIVGLLVPASAINPMFAGVVAIAVLGMTFGAAYSGGQNYKDAGPFLNAFRAFGVGQFFGAAACFFNPIIATVGPLLFYYAFCPARTALNALGSPNTYAKSGTLLMRTAQVVLWPVTTLWSLIFEKPTSSTASAAT